MLFFILFYHCSCFTIFFRCNNNSFRIIFIANYSVIDYLKFFFIIIICLFMIVFVYVFVWLFMPYSLIAVLLLLSSPRYSHSYSHASSIKILSISICFFSDCIVVVLLPFWHDDIILGIELCVNFTLTIVN